MKIRRYVQGFWSRLSIFDIIFFTIILGLASAFYLFFYRRGETVDIRVKVTDQDVLYAYTLPQNSYAQQFIVGDSELDMSGRKISEIIGVEKYPISPTHQVIYLDLRVRATYDSRTDQYYVRGKQVAYGTPMRFTLSKVTFDGIVTHFPGLNDSQDVKTGYTTVKAFLRDKEPHISRSVNKGDVVKDSNGQVMVEVLDVSSKPAEKVTQTDRGDLLLRNDPLYEDVYLTLKVLTKEIQGSVYMFDFASVKVNEVVPLNLTQMSLFPVIYEVIEE